VVIDNNPDKIEECLAENYLAMVGEASDDDILEEAGVRRAKGLVAAVNSDAANVFVVLSARKINPSLHIVARASKGTRWGRRVSARAPLPQGLGSRVPVVLRNVGEGLPGGVDDGPDPDGGDPLAVRRVCEGAGRGGGRPLLAGDARFVILLRFGPALPPERDERSEMGKGRLESIGERSGGPPEKHRRSRGGG